MANSAAWKASLICSLFFLYGTYSYAEAPPPTGNFALPTSQQPGPLMSLGQNIVDKNQAQLFLYMDYFAGHRNHYTDLIPGILYGVTDRLSLFLNLPVAASYQSNNTHSSGLQDTVVQGEYAYYSGSTKRYADQATILIGMTAPTGSSTKQPPTGYGAPSFFLGTTFNRTYTDWYVFASPGVVLPTSKNGTQFGNQYLYQLGLGRNLFNLDTRWMFALITELTGTYSEKNTIHGALDPNSGGNIIYLTPSLWISSKKLIFQLGAGYPVIQHLFGNQNKQNYVLVGSIGYTLS